MPQELFPAFSVKAALALFVPFWRFVNGGRRVRLDASEGAHEPAAQKAPALRVDALFAVPDDVRFHPGHSWARFHHDAVGVGMDDFAYKLVGPLRAIRLPEPGRTLIQGDPGWTLVGEDGKTVEVLSPVDGTVVHVNEIALESPGVAAADPYGEGWLLEIRPSRPDRNLRHLIAGPMARRWTEASWELLSGVPCGGIGLASADGGRPVSGMARAVAGDTWDRVAREHLLTGG